MTFPDSVELCARCGEQKPMSCPDPAAFVPLVGGRFAIINRCDLALVSRYHWRARKKTNIWYAQANIKRDGRRTTICMHQVILGTGWQQRVDHANGDGLDNRRANIRPCTSSQNTANSARRRDAKSRFRGITNNKGYYEARSVMNGKVVYLGTFRTEEEAARCYDAHAAKEFGRFARLNFGPPPPSECAPEEPGVVYVRKVDPISASPRVIAAARALEPDAPGPSLKRLA